jgi:hypothetical protein
MVRDVRAIVAIRGSSQIEDGDLSLRVTLDDVLDNVTTQEAAAADDYNLSE